MVRFFQFGMAVALVTALTTAVCAASWMGGRGAGNTGVFLKVVCPTAPAVVWKAYLGAAYAEGVPSDTLVAGPQVIAAFGAKLVAVSAATGEVSWTQDLPSAPVGDILLLDNQVIVTLPVGRVLAYDPATGEQIWDQRLLGEVVNSPSCTSDALVFATEGNSFEVLARVTGHEITTTDVHAQIKTPPLSVGEGAILLCFEPGNMVLIERGSIHWTGTLGGDTITRPAIADDTYTLVTGEKGIYAIDTTSADTPICWQYPCPHLTAEPVALDGETVYLTTTDGQLHALKTRNGQERWGDRGMALPAPATASPMVFGDALFVRMQYGQVAVFDKTSGALRWQYRLSPSSRNLAVGAPAIVGDDLYFAASDGVIYHLAGAMPDSDPPTFSNVLPTMAGKDFPLTSPLRVVGAVITDEGSGVRASSVAMHLDGHDLTANMQYDAHSGYYYAPVPADMPLPAGAHRLEIHAKDYRGNLGVLTSTFFVLASNTAERLPVVLNGGLLPAQAPVRPGTLMDWVNHSGGPMTIAADDQTFTSTSQYPDGIPDGGHWTWTVPLDLTAGTVVSYHSGVGADANDTQRIPGTLTLVAAQQNPSGFPSTITYLLPSFPTPDFFKE
jgi:outer membrane protein assembly factor BamB